MTMAVPYKDSTQGKKVQIAAMFNSIAKWYDFLNHFLTLGIDIIWRKKAIAKLKDTGAQHILDIATGTGDLAIAAAKLRPATIIGIDISIEMVNIGKAKVEKKNLQRMITLQEGDSEKIIFPENYFDAATCGFGVRNFENLQAGLRDIRRVLKPGATLVVLEFSKPQKFPVKQLYSFYFKAILPVIGRIFSRSNSAYSYLPESVNDFPFGEMFCAELQKAGFKNTKAQTLAFGIASIYTATK